MVKREIVAGVTTFLTMAYIIVVNPSILATEGTGMAFSGVLTATVLIASLMTIFMGLYAKLPFAIAPGMGLNAFFTFNLILGHKIEFPVALGLVFWSGVLFLLLSLTRFREAVADAVPKSLRLAAAAGIGIFLTFIGLKNMGLIVANPATLVGLGKITPQAITAIVAMLFAVVLLRKKNPFALLVPIAVVTLTAGVAGWIEVPREVFAAPDFESVFFKVDFWGALKIAYLPAILSLLFTDLFDSISTFVGVANASGLLDENGRPKNIRQALVVDAFATLSSGLVGTSSGTAYIESAAGVEAGGRTGLTSVVTGLCFLPFLFVSPLIALVPAYATAPVLVVVGALMFKSVIDIKLDQIEDAVPSFLTVVLIPLTFSITQGILWGFISHVVLYLLCGRKKEIQPLMFGLAAVSVLLLYIDNTY